MLGELYDFPEGTMTIGRLDYDSEGLLLLTTDGKVSYEIRSAKYEKEYLVQVDGIITTRTLQKMQAGVDISIHGKTYHTKPCKSSLVDAPDWLPPNGYRIRDERHGPTSWLSITLREGKYRQVRKMTAAVGYPTLRLIRIRIGHILIGQMGFGEVKEVESLIV